MKTLTEFPPEVKKGQMVCIDFETFGQPEGKLHRPTGTFACVSVNLEGAPDTVYQLYDSKDLRKLYQIIKKGLPVYHNATYDLRQFRRYVDIKPQFTWDTLLVEQSMFGGYYQNFSLADLSRRWLGKIMDKDTRTEFTTATEMTPAMKRYAALDVVHTLQIAIKQREAFKDDSGFRAYTHADEPMIWPVLDLQGFRIDVEAWEKMVAEFQQKATQLESELGFNSKSTQQCIKALEKVGLHVDSTGKEILEAYQKEYPLAKAILGTRLYRDAVSKYGMKWLESSVESDGKVYPDFHITGASTTGRMSCSNPNLQNIPQRKLPEYRLRFIASEGYVIDVSDIHQQEPCITAYHTQDRRLLEAIKNHEDLHLMVAQEIYENPKLTKENEDERGLGKIINLGTTYGLSVYGLMEKTGMSEQESERFLNKYFQKFPGVHAWINRQRREGYAKGFVTTALGRRSYLNIHDRKWENNAINSPIQGGAADFTKRWARLEWEKRNAAGLPHTTVGWIHDETVKDNPKEIARELNAIRDEAFQEAAEQLYPGVPFSLESINGKSWGAKKLSTELVELDYD